MVGVGVLGDAVDEDEGHAGLRPPGWRMIARTLPETMAGMPCDFSHRGSRVIVRGRAPWQAPQIGAGVGRMAREVPSKILDGLNDLVIMAPIRRSEECRVGKEGGSTGRSRWSAYNTKKIIRVRKRQQK